LQVRCLNFEGKILDWYSLGNGKSGVTKQNQNVKTVSEVPENVVVIGSLWK
jgi:hypothetical protein